MTSTHLIAVILATTIPLVGCGPAAEPSATGAEPPPAATKNPGKSSPTLPSVKTARRADAEVAKPELDATRTPDAKTRSGTKPVADAESMAVDAAPPSDAADPNSDSDADSAEGEAAARLVELRKLYPSAAVPPTGDKTKGLWSTSLATASEPRPLGHAGGLLVVGFASELLFVRRDDGQVVDTALLRTPVAEKGALLKRRRDDVVMVGFQDESDVLVLNRDTGKVTGELSESRSCWPVYRGGDYQSFFVLGIDDEEGGREPEAWHAVSDEGKLLERLKASEVRPALACDDPDPRQARDKGRQYWLSVGVLRASRKDSELWHTPVPAAKTDDVRLEAYRHTVVVSGATGGKLQVFAARTGQRLWATPATATTTANDNGTATKPGNDWSTGSAGIYAVAHDDPKTLHLKDYGTGRVLWKHAFETNIGGVLSYGDATYIVVGGALIAFSQPKVKRDWLAAPIPGEALAAPKIARTSIAGGCAKSLDIPAGTTVVADSTRAATGLGDRAVAGATLKTANTGKDVLLWAPAVGKTPAWTHRIGQRGDEELMAMAAAPDQGLIIAIHSDIYGTKNKQLQLIRFDKQGRQLWDRNVGRRKQDRIRALAVSPQGVLFAGTAKFGKGAWLGGTVDSSVPRAKVWNRWVSKRGRKARPDAIVATDNGLVFGGFRSFEGGSDPRLWLSDTKPDGKKAKGTVYGAFDTRYRSDVAVAGPLTAIAGVVSTDPKAGPTRLRVHGVDAGRAILWTYSTSLADVRYDLAPRADGGWWLWFQNAAVAGDPTTLVELGADGQSKERKLEGLAIEPGNIVSGNKSRLIGRRTDGKALVIFAPGASCAP